MSHENAKDGAQTYEDEKISDSHRDEVIQISDAEPNPEDDHANTSSKNKDQLDSSHNGAKTQTSGEDAEEERMDDAAIIEDIGSIGTKKPVVGETAVKMKRQHDEPTTTENVFPVARRSGQGNTKKEIKIAQMKRRKELFGSFAANEIEWKLILTFIVFVFAISVVACTFVVFVFLQEKDFQSAAAVIDEVEILIEQERIEARRKLLNGSANAFVTRMRVVKEDVTDASDFVDGVKSNQSENVKERFEGQQKPVSKEITNVDEYIEDNIKEHYIEAAFQTSNYTLNITQQTKYEQNATSRILATLEKDINSLFEDQDRPNIRLVTDFAKDRFQLLTGQKNIFSQEIRKIKSAAQNGFSEKDTNYTLALRDVTMTLNTDFMDMMGKITMKIESQFNPINSVLKYTGMTVDLRLSQIKSNFSSIISVQNMGFESGLGDAVIDLMKFNAKLESNVEMTVSKKLLSRKKEYKSKLTMISTNLTDDVDEALKKAITDAYMLGNVPMEIFDPDLAKIETEFEDLKFSVSEKVRTVKDALMTQSDAKLILDTPQQCSEARYQTAIKWKANEGGTYKVAFPPFQSGLTVFCSSKHEGWMVIMRLEEKTEIFDKNFEDYKSEMGNSITGNYWFGLENLHKLTSINSYKIRVEYWTGKTKKIETEIYENFVIGDEASNYKLKLGDYVQAESTVPKNSELFAMQNEKAFSTKDVGSEAEKSCAVSGGGGWWYSKTSPCQSIKLTGKYYPTVSSHAKATDGMFAKTKATFVLRAEMSIKIVYI